MNWTTEKPTQEGYYWCKNLNEKYVPDRGIYFFERQTDGTLEPASGPLSAEGWDWFSGPIEEPIGTPPTLNR